MLKLIIGNRNYSSWSLRAWLLLSTFEVDFEVEVVSLKLEGLRDRYLHYSPTAKVPVLLDGDLSIWDSLAICEYVSEKYLNGKGWPTDQRMRATARSLAAEMHAGFTGIRTELPLNCRGRKRIVVSPETQLEIERMDSMWSSCLNQHGGPWLMGEFSIVDCFYAPVVLRFQTYHTTLSPTAHRYYSHTLEHPQIQQWLQASAAETEVITRSEVGTDT